MVYSDPIIGASLPSTGPAGRKPKRTVAAPGVDTAAPGRPSGSGSLTSPEAGSSSTASSPSNPPPIPASGTPFATAFGAAPPTATPPAIPPPPPGANASSNAPGGPKMPGSEGPMPPVPAPPPTTPPVPSPAAAPPPKRVAPHTSQSNYPSWEAYVAAHPGLSVEAPPKSAKDENGEAVDHEAHKKYQDWSTAHNNWEAGFETSGQSDAQGGFTREHEHGKSNEADWDRQWAEAQNSDPMAQQFASQPDFQRSVSQFGNAWLAFSNWKNSQQMLHNAFSAGNKSASSDRRAMPGTNDGSAFDTLGSGPGRQYVFYDKFGRETGRKQWDGSMEGGASAAGASAGSLPGQPGGKAAPPNGVPPLPPGYNPSSNAGNPEHYAMPGGAPGQMPPVPAPPPAPVNFGGGPTPAPGSNPGPMAPPPMPAPTRVPPVAAPPPTSPTTGPVPPVQKPPVDANALPGQPGAAPPAPAPGQPGMAPAPMPPQQLARVPSPDEINAMQPGQSYITPMGTVEKRADGSSSVVLSPSGQEAYKRAKVKAVKSFGPHPFANNPAAPPPPVEPGMPSFNPFTGMWA